jgi:DeoR/GlpR family transcriptional regulator of sugar metabolism
MRVPQHLVDRRRKELCSLIRLDGFLPVAEICRHLKVSPATVRRDLVAIEANGLISRTHGGALADYNIGFASHGERAGRARTAKGRIAVGALTLVPLSGKIFLDAGTTVQALARQLLRRRKSDGLIVVTNSLPVASMLGGAPGIELHLLGGMFLHRQSVLLGKEAVEGLARWRFDAAFLGGEALNSHGITNSHAELAAFQQTVVARSKSAWFLLDATKVGRATPHQVTSWKPSVGLVTDAPLSTLAAASINLGPARLHLVH